MSFIFPRNTVDETLLYIWKNTPDSILRKSMLWCHCNVHPNSIVAIKHWDMRNTGLDMKQHIERITV